MTFQELLKSREESWITSKCVGFDGFCEPEEIKSFNRESMEAVLEWLSGEVEGIKCKVPKNPFPINIRDIETLSVGRIDDCLHYAGRVNYNKGLSDIITKLEQAKKEIK